MSVKAEKITILAPVSGLATPLDDVPDPTFAQRMAGDGMAVDPTGERVLAPCDGRITQFHPARHAFTVTTARGVEVLVHVGLETVTLGGRGFEALAAEGDEVKAGDPLIEFDADFLARSAPTLVTIVLVTNDGAAISRPASGLVEAGATPLFEASVSNLSESAGAGAPDGSGAACGIGAAGAAAGSSAAAKEIRSEPIVILNPDGLHARPSATLAAAAKKFGSIVRIESGTRSANAKSVVGIMGLAIKLHDKIVLSASGDDADKALETLAALIASGLGENLHALPKSPKTAQAASKPPKAAPKVPKVPEAPKVPDLSKPDALAKPAAPAPEAPGAPGLLSGVPASPGIACGPIFQLRDFEAKVSEAGKGVEVELSALNDAVAKAGSDLAELSDRLRAEGDTAKAAIFAAHRELLEDPALIDEATEGVKGGQSAAFSWRQSYRGQAEALARLDDELLAGRAADIRDVGTRVMRILAGDKGERPPIPAGAILVGPDLTPTDAANLSKSGAAGFCVTGGSATSHASILARAAGVPAVVAAPGAILDLPDGSMAILDGTAGTLKADPSPEEIRVVEEDRKRLAAEREEELAAAVKPATTIDGFRLKVVGNIGSVAEAASIPGLGGEGVGLLRSEFLFLDRLEAPSEDEQTDSYVAIAQALGNHRDLIVRTLDVGGDKPLAYMPLPPEENPFLGIRGIRLNLLGTDVFRAQVRAALRAAPYARLGLMFPMVATIEEFRAARDLVMAERGALGVEEPVSVGVMVEVPSAALGADALAREADFLSIGTNDLTQYCLAVDRGHPGLAKMADALHPAVLRLIGMTCEAGARHGKWVGVCGGIAADPLAVPALIGLGVDELSVPVGSIPAVKAAARRLSRDRCREIAAAALRLSTAAEVRSLLKDEAGASGGEAVR